jgi:hypothetical protein|tara:strand:+ start:7156 stop:7293 length:138 start_codon:yes stop_codon:yes gene_type:complete
MASMVKTDPATTAAKAKLKPGFIALEVSDSSDFQAAVGATRRDGL